ncbi:MAG: SRPBCC domain-containing protein [Pseudomonadota bacterium]|nr:SRPBCC domain-containing protein [Pseudomonadota bacterium]
MTVADIIDGVEIHAPPERVYEALTTADGVRAWWMRDADLEPRIGGAGEFRFQGHELATKVSVEDLAPPARVAWRVTASQHPEWVGTTISFDLRPEAGGAALAFAQRGYAEAGDCYALCTTGWTHYLASLKAYVETGKGDPHA